MGIQSIIPKLKTQDTIVFSYTLFTSEDKLCLAPMQNLTSLFFRKSFSKFFPMNFDYAVSPFISVSSNPPNRDSIALQDISTKDNKDLIPVVPQILGNNPKQIIEYTKIIEDLGYREVNLNMGCPKRDIVNHKRGSGLLREKDLVRDIFEVILNNTKLQLSIKVRLGINDATELENLLPLINNYPLKSVFIHPRTQIQQYTGKVDLSAFEYFASKIKPNVVYNGDIFSAKDFTVLKQQFPYIKHWMIGRGVLKNPFLCADIRGIAYDKEAILWNYIIDLKENFSASLKHYNEIAVLNKMKEFAKYLSQGYCFDATELLRLYSLNDFLIKLHHQLSAI